MNKRLYAVITGRVQRVGYRDFVEDAADLLELTGWVRNLYNGDVEVVVEGEEPKLQQFSALISTGPSLAFVRNYTEDWSPATGEFRDFAIRVTSIGD